MTRDRLEAAVGAVGACIPPDAVRHGWNVANLQLRTDLASLGDRWEVRLIGPVEAETYVVETVGGERSLTLMVHTGSHGSLTAGTLDDLTRLVREWIGAVGSWI